MSCASGAESSNECRGSLCGCGACAEWLSRLWAGNSRVQEFLARRGASSETALDIVSDTYLIAWRRRLDVPSARDEAIAWLCEVARRLLSNHRRSNARVVLPGDGVEVTTLSWLNTEDLVLEDHLARRAWRSLSEADREVLRASAMASSTEQVAVSLGCTQGAARTRLSRARKRLRLLTEEL